MNVIFNKDYVYYNVAIFALACSLSYLVKKYFALSGTYVLFGFLFVSLYFLLRGYGAKAVKVSGFRVLYSFVPLLLLFIYFCILGVFGDFDFSSIVFHIEMGTGGHIPHGLVNPILRYALSFLGVAASLAVLINLDKRFLVADRALFIPLFLVNPMLLGIADYLLINRYDDRLLQAYHQPEHLTLPARANKNLLMIYAESMERSFSEISHGEASFAEMSRLAASGLEVAGIRQVNNTGWSMAGFVTTQCGMPLQRRGMLTQDMNETQESFFAGIPCLSDILNDNGYHTEFMNGSDHGFAGMKPFLDTHNFSYISGLLDYNNDAGSYLNSWGLFDDTLFEQAEIRIRKLHEAGRPYAFSVATISAHFPDGHPTKSCDAALEGHGLPPILYAVKCTGYEIERFLNNLREEGYLKNTIIVIVSDHLMMKNQFTNELDKTDRMNYFTVLADDIQPQLIKRDAAMFDVFPTILDLLGFPLKDGRAGLGVSLLSDYPTLVEEYGLTAVNDFIRNDKLLAYKAWMKPEASTEKIAKHFSVK
ncbi:sulfatase-like hydrolase/transferase [Pseudochrobactrum sp. MP213Fo]|uniref:sulfatase-like hydrolase/transferase n=1 Tax=Pseudochrobactrum sp. MP213Fo TaxID=3022250 RepID=UPI003BA3C6D0